MEGVFYLKKRKFTEDIIAVVLHLKKCHEKGIRPTVYGPRLDLKSRQESGVINSLGLSA